MSRARLHAVEQIIEYQRCRLQFLGMLFGSNTAATPTGVGTTGDQVIFWYRLPGLNRGPLDPQSSALTN